MKVLIPVSAAIVMTAAFMGAASAQTAQVRQPWCGVVDGARNCVYPTLAECEKWMRPDGGECVPDPRPPVRR
jgi:hypothetical protein